MDPALLATLRIHNPWLERPEEGMGRPGPGFPHVLSTQEPAAGTRCREPL
jgi:hypothetical protein